MSAGKTQILGFLLLTLALCVPVNADIVFSYGFFRVGTTIPVPQPVKIGRTFDAVIFVEDTGPVNPLKDNGLGVSGIRFDFFFDTSRLTQDPNAMSSELPHNPDSSPVDWLNVGGSETTFNATGGRATLFQLSADNYRPRGPKLRRLDPRPRTSPRLSGQSIRL